MDGENYYPAEKTPERHTDRVNAGCSSEVLGKLGRLRTHKACAPSFILKAMKAAGALADYRGSYTTLCKQRASTKKAAAWYATAALGVPPASWGRGSWQLDYNSPSTKSFLPKTTRHHGRPFHPTMRARLEICAASLIHSLGGRLCRWPLPHTPPLGPKTHEGITFRTCSKQSIILCLLAVIIGIVHTSSAYYGHNIMLVSVWLGQNS